MAADMKNMIAEAAKRLLLEKKVKKLTVKDIVEECQITRQAFYYHFEDIPDMFQWVLKRGTEQLMQEIRAQGDHEAGLRYFFLVAANASPLIRRGMETNYSDEIERLLGQVIYRLFEQAVESLNLYQNCSRYELKLVLRYHSQAVMGILRDWTDEDTEHMDEIVHSVYLLLTGGMAPQAEGKKNGI